MIDINEKQKELVKTYLKKSYTDIYQLLLDLDDKITEIGFDDNYDLNEEGIYFYIPKFLITLSRRLHI